MTLIERLRSCLRFDEPNVTEFELEACAREAADRIEELERVVRMALDALNKSHPISNSDKDLDKHSEAISELRRVLREQDE